MRKFILIAAISSIFFGCGDNSSTAPQICQLKKLYYGDVIHEPYLEYYDLWMAKSCKARIGDACAEYDNNFYIEIEECGNIYYKD